jgi:hypothetical protein
MVVHFLAPAMMFLALGGAIAAPPMKARSLSNGGDEFATLALATHYFQIGGQPQPVPVPQPEPEPKPEPEPEEPPCPGAGCPDILTPEEARPPATVS